MKNGRNLPPHMPPGAPPPGAVAADRSKLDHINTYGDLPEFYVDYPFACRDCGKTEVWTASRQKWYYEEAKGKLDALARTVPLDASTSARLPEPLHCVAMKLKAVTSTRRRADNQDWGDILNLFRLFRIDPADGRTRELVLRYGDAALLDRLRADLERLP